jgi:hypothetical protein
MAGKQKDSTSNGKQAKPVRPVLIVSESFLSEYSTYLEHLLTGLVSESVQVCLVYPSRSSIESILPPTVEVIKHPAIDLPLTGYYNKKLLLERLGKFRPTLLHCLCQSKAWLTRQLARHFSVPYVLTINSIQNVNKSPSM